MSFNGYTNIPDWMLSLELDVYETIILAVIYGFSQDGESTFKGTQQYLADKAKCSKRKVGNALVNLVDRKLIQKIDVDIRGIHLCEYKVTDTCTMCKGIAPHATGGVAPGAGGIAPHATNIIDNINISPTEINNKKRFDFKRSLIELGVSPEVAEDWMQVRKMKRASNTETAFKRLVSEIEKTGLSANECITIAVSRSWQGFQAEWVANQQWQRAAGKMSVLDNNRMVAEQLMRMAGMEETL
jgi:hypothetical protein